MSLQIVVQDCDLSHVIHAGGEAVRKCRVFTIELPELESYLREQRTAEEKAKAGTAPHPYWTRQVISVEPTPLP